MLKNQDWQGEAKDSPSPILPPVKVKTLLLILLLPDWTTILDQLCLSSSAYSQAGLQVCLARPQPSSLSPA